MVSDVLSFVSMSEAFAAIIVYLHLLYRQYTTNQGSQWIQK